MEKENKESFGKREPRVQSEVNMTKKLWQKPQLIVIVRNRPEESVLTGCKSEGGMGDSGTSNFLCGWAACTDCYDQGTS